MQFQYICKELKYYTCGLVRDIEVTDNFQLDSFNIQVYCREPIAEPINGIVGKELIHHTPDNWMTYVTFNILNQIKERLHLIGHTEFSYTYVPEHAKSQYSFKITGFFIRYNKFISDNLEKLKKFHSTANLNDFFGKPYVVPTKPSTPDIGGRVLNSISNALSYEAKHTHVKCPLNPIKILNLLDMIIHLNDTHHWSRKQIADWLETLDVDIEFKKPQSKPKTQGTNLKESCKEYLKEYSAAQHLFKDLYKGINNV